ncbi:sigma-70 family RNA polymerase sigma factor [Rossellomorea aquimaris]|uniref:sigma-70 family RNA polymerase sigma factor n=1 Tax=Rossellomorea aquimaris TaxID=189382 RepID=UPI001CD3265C|nr:sigma-70 family RNA polymerase sigma factor [Rossellomorea aquimaris]MCA1057204.1 sigma-70 family RNA polymerase sigma factor [Rossellomorea aquimaris]
MQENRNAASPDASRDLILEKAMRDYGNDIYYIVYSYVKDHSLAEDLTQEVFVKVYKKMDSFREESSLKTWIVRMAINHCKDHLRRWDTRMISFTNTINDMVKGKFGTPEQSMIEEETKSELIKHLLSLPVKYREIIFLFYFEEMKLSEIADCMDLNINTVKTRLAKGRKLLGATYQKSEVYNNG